MTTHLMRYKDYYGSYHLDAEEQTFYGKLEFIKALVTYEASTAKDLQKAFENAVEDYLTTCKQEDIKPEKPFKGSFNVRLGENLHRKVALAALSEDIPMNHFVCKALEEKTNVIEEGIYDL